MKPIDIMLDDLGRQIAEKSLAAAEWKARALSAEDTLAKMYEAAKEEDQEEDQEEEPDLSVVYAGEGEDFTEEDDE